MPAKTNNFEVCLRIYSPRTGRFPFNQNFQKFGKSGKWYRNFPEKFPEIPKAWISEMRTIQPKILEVPGAKLLGKIFSKIWVHLVRLSSFLIMSGNAVPFAAGSYRKFNGKRPCFHGIVRSVIGWKIARHFSQPIKIKTYTKRDLITFFFPRLAPDANLYFEFWLVHFFISSPSTPLHSPYVKPSL